MFGKLILSFPELKVSNIIVHTSMTLANSSIDQRYKMPIFFRKDRNGCESVHLDINNSSFFLFILIVKLLEMCTV